MSHELKPCPNPACTNWNPFGRARCFKCGQDLKVAEQVDEDPSGHSRLRGSLIMLGAVALVLLAWYGARWNEARKDSVKPIVRIDAPSSAKDGKAKRVIHSNKHEVEIKGVVDDEHPDQVSAEGVVAPITTEKGFTLKLPVGEALHVVKLVAKDKNGNESAPVEIEIGPDSVPPEIVDLSPVDGAFSPTEKVLVEGEANEDLSSAVVGTTSGEVKEGRRFEVRVPLKGGANALVVKVRDLADNETTRTLNVAYDARPLPKGIVADGQAFVSEKDGSKLALVPEQTAFTMGTTQGQPDERPPHSVKVSAFLIDVTPVTNAQYQKFMAETQRPAPAPPDFDRKYMESQPNGPVVNVTYQDATAYAEWAGRRLPTEAEWELAARGTDGRLFPWGSDAPTAAGEITKPEGPVKVANIDGAADGFKAVAPVGSFPEGKSPYGVLDMAGNVWQWVVDPYDASFYSSPAAGDNPSGPDQGEMFVLRGGAFTSTPNDVRSTNRNSRKPTEAQANSGFRTAASFD